MSKLIKIVQIIQIVLLVGIVAINIPAKAQEPNKPVYSSGGTFQHFPVWHEVNNDYEVIRSSIMLEGENKIIIGISSPPIPIERLFVNGNIGLDQKIYFKGGSACIIWANSPGYKLNFQALLPDNTARTRMCITENGYVGIGTTIPSEKLHVNGTILTNGFKMPQPGIEDGYVLTTDRNGNSAWLPTQSLWELGVGNNIYRLKGNVGIGTDMPLTKFQIGDKWTFIDQEMKSIGFNVTYNYEDYYRINDGPGAILNFEPSGAISMWMAPTGLGGTRIDPFVQSVIFDNFGNVGIGTRIPTANLDVNGKIKTTEFQLLNGNLNEYILRCDNDGNAYWADPADLDDGDWNMTGNNLWVDENKKVGIGISTPSEKLHINGSMLITGDIKGSRNSWDPLTIYAGSTEDDGAYMTLASNFDNTGSIKMYSKGTSGSIEFHNQNIQVMSIRANNDIVMGNPNPDGDITLFVNGNIEANKIRVSTESWWDKVLKPDYKLRSLSQLETFIKENKHLPDIPSEKEVKENGIDVGEMNALLVKKIEELTLYTIEQQKEIEQLKGLVKELIETK